MNRLRVTFRIFPATGTTERKEKKKEREREREKRKEFRDRKLEFTC